MSRGGKGGDWLVELACKAAEGELEKGEGELVDGKVEHLS